MYSESDLDNAVTAGAISADAATALRRHVAVGRQSPAVDEEQFRLLTGFNDIFVSIAIVLLLAALGGIGEAITPVLAPVLVTAAAWGLAEYFTARRRMALPSIILLLAFVGGVAASFATPLIDNGQVMEDWLKSLGSESMQIAAVSAIVAGIAAITAAAAWFHWRRFMVPITVAAGAVAVVSVAIALIVALIQPREPESILPLLLVAGLGMFAFAMRWDMSDLERRTRRSDVAFWLHLAAAPMIAHALFHMLGVFDGEIGVGQAIVVLLLYVAFAFVALAVDRRALLVSSLAYVLYALYTLFQQAGAVELSAAFTGLVIGSALLLLSAFWQPARRRVVALLGNTSHRLPPVALAV